MNTRTMLAAIACTVACQAPATADDGGGLATCGTTEEDRTTSRDEVQTRSQSWLDAQVPYSQQACHRDEHGDYRTDCSGYVSMVWGLTHSRNTTSLSEVAAEIPRADLKTGDALNSAGHVALFIRWDDEAKTEPVVREHTGPDGSPPVERVWPADTANTYTPIRYNNITEP